MGINAEKVLRLLNQKQETRGERIARLVAEKRAQQGGAATVVSSVPEATAAQENNDRFFKAGAFSDGYQFGDVIKTILGTAGDIGVNAVKGAGSLVEGVTDLLGYAGAGIADLVGADEFASDWKKNIQKNTVDAIFKGAEDYVDKSSVLGGRSDAISQGLGQVAAIILTGGAASAAGLGTAGATALTTGITGLSGMGSGMSQAYQEGATDGEAVAYGAIAGTAEALTELIFAGMGKSVKALGFSKGLSSADDILAKKLSSKISSQLGKNLVELGVKAGAEGTEEVLSGVAQAFGKKLTYMSEEDLGKIIKNERLLDQFITGAITSGIAQSGIVPGMKAGSFIEATKAGRDFITVDDTDTEKMAQKNTTQEGGVKYSLAAFEKDGRRFVEINQNQERFDGHSPDEYPGIAKEIIKEKFENRVIGIDNKMFVNGAGRSEFAYPSKPITDADIYEAKMRSSAELDNLLDAGANYRNEADGKDGHVHPDAVGGFDYYDTLFKIGNRYFEGRINIKNVKRGKLFTDVTQIKDVTQAIMSSYGQNPKSQFLRTSSIDSISNANENVNSQVFEDADYQERYKQYQVDLSQYKPQEQVIYKRHMDSGMVNNRKATHEFVDLLVKLETEKGVHFDLSTSERLAQSGFAVEGATINGVKTGNGILLNINANNVLNSVVGHEIMHVFEGTDYEDVLKQAVKEFAEAKGIYKSRYDSIAKLYAKVQGADIEGELTADLIGEYLFTDKDFVRNLSTKHRNLFQRIYDEIKYLCKLATADSAEARKLEKVKKTFAEMYRDVDVKNTAQTDGVKYALSSNARADVHQALTDKNYAGEVKLTDTSPSIMLSQKDVKNYPMLMNASHIRENVFTEAEAKAMGLRVNPNINYHGLGEELFLKVIDDLDSVKQAYRGTKNADDPARRENYFLLISQQTDRDGNIINVPVFINEKGSYNRVFIDTNKIATVFGRSGLQDYINSQIVKGNLVRIKNRNIQTSESTSPIKADYGMDVPSDNSIRNPDEKVNGKFSLSETKTAESAGGYRITGEDIALAPTKEDIAEQERIATAQDAPRNDVEEMGAPTREDIARQERDKKLKGPLLMKDGLDRELEKLYRLQQTGQIQDDAYFAELSKVNEAYQTAGRDFSEALNRVVGAYQGESINSAATVVNEDAQREERRLTDDDLADYMRVGIRKHVRDEKQKIVDAGDSPILTKPSDIAAFIRNALYGKEKNVVKAYGRTNSKLAKAVNEATKGTVNIDDYYLELDANRLAHMKDHVGEDKDNRNIPLTEKQIEQIPAYVDNFDDLINVICRKDGSVRLMLGKKINGHSIIVETVSKGRKALHPVTAYQVDTSDYISKYKTRAIDRSSTSRSANADTVDISRPATAPAVISIPKDTSGVKYSLGESVAEELGAPTREDILRMEAEKELHGPWRMTDPLDQKVEKLYRMMLREQVSEEDYIAQLVKADRQYQQRGSKVEAALERVREAYSKETTETPETEKKMERLTRKVLHKGIMDRIRDALAKAGFDLNTVLKNAKNLTTFATVDNTPQRVNEKTFGYKAGQIINDLTVNKAALNESDAIQWLNGQIDKIKKMSKRYGIKPGSKESRAAQIYGEGFWVNEVGEYIQYGDAELAADFPDTKKQAKIKALAKSQEVRQMYDETLDAINAARVRNGYPPIPRRDNYFLHFRAQDDTFSRIGVPFNPNDIRAKDLPTDLNGVTADLKPGKPFFASEMRRTGDKTTYDLLGGLERYMNSAKNQIYHIDDIQTLRAMRNYIADMFGQANGLADLDSLSPEEQEQRIKEVFDNHLSTYAKFLNEEANIFAGKTALIDRGVEGVLGRRAIQFLHTLNGQVGKNMVGYNISSAGTNVLPVVQATAMLPKADMVKAFAQTISNKFRSDGFVENDPALIRRKGADQFAKSPWQRISDPGYALMSAVDNLSSELIVRAKYNELTRKGMDSQQAHIRAGEWASRLMGDRSLGQMPQLYNSKTLGLFTKFQLEVRNQLDAMGYDVIQEAKAEEGVSNAKKAAKVASTMAQLAIFQHLFGQAYESIAGYNPTFDIVENLIKLFGFDDEEESEDTVGDNVEQAFLGLLEDLPYTSTFTGGRIPISSALPIEEVITGKDSYGNEKNRLETLAEALPYYILPGGYGQAKKTVAGLKMFDEDLPVAGSYTDSGNLRFPVEEDSIADWLQAALFGQYASKNAREYFDNGWAPLQKKQIEEFAALDIPIADYRQIRKQLGKLETIGEKFDYIDSLDLTVEQKNILVNNVVDRKEPVDMTNYGFFEDFDEFNFYIKNEEKYQFLKDNGIAYKTYNASEESREAYSWAFQNPEKYQVSRAVVEDTVVYKGYAKALSKIEADKDSKGNAVSGSRKKKVVQYLNELDAEYGAKLVLYKLEYPSDDTYNGKIIEYVSSIEGFTYEQKATVLKELGFTVSSDGKVSWN